MLICILPTILGAGLMIGLDPNGVPKNKAGLLAASFLTGTFGAAFMLLLAWNASYVVSLFQPFRFLPFRQTLTPDPET